MDKKVMWLSATVVAVAIVSIAVSAYQSDLKAFAPPEIDGSRNVLVSAEIVQMAGAVGPESIAFDPAGEGPYTGVSDGRILKWRGDSIGWTDFAYTSPNRQDCVRPSAPELEHVCGRPLGLRFDNKTGDLYIADAYFGIMVVGPAGGLARSLISEAEGQPFVFTNDVEIDHHDDVIYFTDSSANFQRRQFLAAVMNLDKTGRLIKYDRSSKETTVLLRNISFANGVALSKDRSFLLVAETTACRILRYWLTGPKSGTHDVFAELPGFPDNVKINSEGEFWVALHSKTGLFARFVLSNPLFGSSMLKLPMDFQTLHGLLIGGKPQATALKLSEKGKVLEVLEDVEGKTLRLISEVEEKDGKLWIGSVLMPFIGTFNL